MTPKAQLAASTRSILREQTPTCERRWRSASLLTEVVHVSNPRDFMHDDPYAALHRQTILEANGLVQDTLLDVSDIFRGENTFLRTVPGRLRAALNIHGIAQTGLPAPSNCCMNWARSAAASKGTMKPSMPGSCAGTSVHPVLTNFALPRHPIETELASFALKSAKFHNNGVRSAYRP